MELRPRKGRLVQAPSTPSEVLKPSPKSRPPSSRRKSALSFSSDEIQAKASSETPISNQQFETAKETQIIGTEQRRIRSASRKTTEAMADVCVETLPAENTTPLDSMISTECLKAASRTTSKSQVGKSRRKNKKDSFESIRILFPDNNEASEAIESVSELVATAVEDSSVYRRKVGTPKKLRPAKKPVNTNDELVGEAAILDDTSREQLILCPDVLHIETKGTTDCMNVDGIPLEKEQQDDQNADSIPISSSVCKEKSIREYKKDIVVIENPHESSASKKNRNMSNKEEMSDERKIDIGGSAKCSRVSSLANKITVVKKVHDENDVHFSEEDCSRNEDDSDDADADDDELAKLFVKSLKTYMQQSDGSSTKEAEKKPVTLEDDNRFSGTMEISRDSLRTKSLDLVWSPKVELQSSKNIRSTNCKSSSNVMAENIWKNEAKLQDGLVVPPIDPLKLNKLARKQKDNTAGAKWFNLAAPTITPELKKELQLLKLRGVVDPKRHYKADDSKGLPKYFEVGTVVGGPTDFYSGRLTKKERKSSVADELLSDYSLSSYRKRKYLEIQDQKKAGGKSFWKAKTKKRTPTWAKL